MKCTKVKLNVRLETAFGGDKLRKVRVTEMLQVTRVASEESL